MKRRGKRSPPREEEFLIESGRASRGMFLRVVYLPTGRSRMISHLSQHLQQVGMTYEELLSAIQLELSVGAEKQLGETGPEGKGG